MVDLVNGINGKALAEQFTLKDEASGKVTALRNLTDEELTKYAREMANQCAQARQGVLVAVNTLLQAAQVSALIDYESDCRARKLQIATVLPLVRQ